MSLGPPRFDRAFDPRHGEAVRLSPLVRRVTVRNPGPFTFHGTNTYLVGDRDLAVIDPGPDYPAHREALLDAIGPARVAAILVTHTHRDHSPGARALAALTGAPVYGEGPHRPARPLNLGEINPLDASGDKDFVPDRKLSDGQSVAGQGWTLTALATPGHCATHLAFAFPEEEALFSGDHVMAWSTSIVAPPDGAMRDYMASLERLVGRSETVYWPGHGGPVRDPQDFVAALKAHRLGREKAVLDRVAAGDDTIPAMVSVIYADVDRALHGAAALSVLAHVEDLAERGLIRADGPVSLQATYRLARD
ncbi:MBL fold metallo-hydrolase [Prosthecomicrobium sp. N25]|uniref:MBL fold metallo-hydrolase n=1 Tax=Prosthecomicrobium sp. N25 TaxID=3129254 RepID=UPI003077D179